MISNIGLKHAFRSEDPSRSFYRFPTVRCEIYSEITDGRECRYARVRNLPSDSRIPQKFYTEEAFRFRTAIPSSEFFGLVMDRFGAMERLRSLPFVKEENSQTPKGCLYGVSSGCDDAFAVRIPIYDTGVPAINDRFPVEGASVKINGYWFRVCFTASDAIVALENRIAREKDAYAEAIQEMEKEMEKESSRAVAYIGEVSSRQDEEIRYRKLDITYEEDFGLWIDALEPYQRERLAELVHDDDELRGTLYLV